MVKHNDYRKRVVWHNRTNIGLLIKGAFTFFCMLGRFSNSFPQQPQPKILNGCSSMMVYMRCKGSPRTSPATALLSSSYSFMPILVGRPLSYTARPIVVACQAAALSGEA